MKEARALRHDALQVKIKDTHSPQDVFANKNGESRSYAALKARMGVNNKGMNNGVHKNEGKESENIRRGVQSRPHGKANGHAVKAMFAVITGLWMVGACVYGAFYVGAITPIGLGLFITALFAPPAFVWGMVNAFVPIANAHKNQMGQNQSVMPADIAGLPAAIETYTAALEDALARSRMSVKENIFDLQTQNDAFDSAAARMEKQIVNMSVLSQEGLSAAEKIAGTLEDKTQVVSDNLKTQSASLESTAHALIDAVKSAEQYGVKAAARLTKTLSVAKTETESLTGSISAMSTRFDDSAQNASEHMQTVIARTGEHTAMLGNIGASYGADIDAFSDKLDAKISRLEGVQKSLDTPVQNLQHTIEDAEKRYAVIEEKLSALNDTLSDKREALVREIDDSRAQAHKQVGVLKTLSENINQSLSALNTADTVDEFERLLDNAARAQATIEGLGAASDAAQKKTRVLNDAAENTADTIKAMGDETRLHIEDMLNATHEKIEKIHAREQDVVRATQETVNTLEGTLKHTKVLRDDIAVNISRLSKESEAANTKLTRQTSTLQSQMDAIATAGTVAAKHLERAHALLNNKTQNFMDVSAAALNAAHDASDTIHTHSKTLQDAAHTARDVAKDIQTKRIKTREQETIESGEFILESLHSVAVDLNRITQGGISERLWKAYQGGEKNIFTKATLSFVETVPAADLIHKFKNDTEFRTAVLRFAARFEEFLDDIGLTDDAAKTSQSLLQEAIITSDIAKLYTTLCGVAGKRGIL